MPKQTLTFILNKNLDFPVTKEPWINIFSAAGIQAEETADLAKIDQLLTAGGPDLAYVAGAAFCVMLRQIISTIEASLSQHRNSPGKPPSVPCLSSAGTIRQRASTILKDPSTHT